MRLHGLDLTDGLVILLVVVLLIGITRVEGIAHELVKLAARVSELERRIGK